MQEVAVDRSGKRTDQVKVFFESIIYCFDFRAPAEEDLLPLCHDLCLLLEVRSGEYDGAELLPHMLSHHDASVMRVSNGEASAVINQFRQDLTVVDIRWREVEVAQLAIEADRQVQFETVVRTLVVVSEGSNVFGYPMPTCSMQSADFQHGGIDETNRSIDAEIFQELPQVWKNSMTMCEEAVVFGQPRKLFAEIQTGKGVEIFEGLLPEHEGIPDKECHKIAVT